MGARISYESSRGCGFRKEGGIYLVASGSGIPCGKLPLRVETCPTCGSGIKPARGFTWIDPLALFAKKVCALGERCRLSCPLADVRLPDMGRAGLLWIGEKFYPTPEAFSSEADRMGISRRISAIPRDFKLGETWILLGHRKGSLEACPDCGDRDAGDRADCETCGGRGRVDVAAIFRVFKPEAIEKIVPEDISDEEVEKLEKKGISPVIVRRLDGSGTPEIPFEARREEPRKASECASYPCEACRHNRICELSEERAR